MWKNVLTKVKERQRSPCIKLSRISSAVLILPLHRLLFQGPHALLAWRQCASQLARYNTHRILIVIIIGGFVLISRSIRAPLIIGSPRDRIPESESRLGTPPLALARHSSSTLAVHFLFSFLVSPFYIHFLSRATDGWPEILIHPLLYGRWFVVGLIFIHDHHPAMEG